MKAFRPGPWLAMAALAVIAFVAVWTMVWRPNDPPPGDPGVGADPAESARALRAESHAVNGPQDGRGRSAADPARHVPERRPHPTPASLLSRYDCGAETEDLRHCATREDEAEWLRHRGFPTTDEAAYVRGAPDHELEARATRGDAVAAMELAARHWLAGREQESLRWRREPLNGGSVYAHNAMADLLLASGDPQDIASAAIRLRVAQQLGDVRAMFRLHRLIDENPGLDWRTIDFTAMGMMQAIERNNPGVCLFSGVRPVRSRE